MHESGIAEHRVIVAGHTAAAGGEQWNGALRSSEARPSRTL